MTTRLVTIEPARGSRPRRALRRVVHGLRAVAWRRRLAAFGPRSVIDRPAWILGGRSIAVGRTVHIWPGARIEAHNADHDVIRVSIGDETAIHPFAHIGAVDRVDIEQGCLIAAGVYITDHDHVFTDPSSPPINNRQVIAARTHIGAYTWLGERVTVLKGVRIGEHCVIGAGSIVTRDIPPYTVAVGTPARPVRRFDPEAHDWREMAA